MVKIVSANIKKTLDKPAVVRCAKLAKRHGDILGFQEIKSEADQLGLIDGLGVDFITKNLSCSNPLAFNAIKYRLAKSMELPGGFQHRGIFTLSAPSKNPNDPERTGSYVVLKELRRENLPPVAFFNGHLPNRKPWLRGEEKERNEEDWREAFAEYQWRVNTFLKYGITSVWMGDLNKLIRRVPPFNPFQKVLSLHGLDHMYVAKGRSPQAAKFTIRGEYEVDTPSDHHMIVGKVLFTLP